MNCSSCGKVIPRNSKFCRYCGNKLSISHKTETQGIRDGIADKSFKKAEYAGFWVRLGAYVIDILGILGGSIAIGFFLGILFGETAGENLPDIVWSYFSYVIYSTFALTVWSTTFGKHLYGLRVITGKNGELDFGTALKRSLLQPFSTLFFGIGYWNMYKNRKNQAWHDTTADTAVVREKKDLTLAYIMTVIGLIVWAYLYSLGA